jgi:hypothetical protein
MPQVDVFMSESDLEQIVSSLLAAGCVLVPDEISEQPKAHEIASLQEFRSWRSEQKIRLFFAVSADWTVTPLEWGEVEKHGHRVYFIQQKVGGPTLDIFAPFPFRSESGRESLPHGFIDYHPSFWNSLANRNEKPPDALKATYRRIVKQLRSNADQKQGKNRTYIVATGAKELLRSGVLLGPPFQQAPTPDSPPLPPRS